MSKKNKKILMIGSHLSVKGGMSTVVKNILDSELRSSIIYIPTHRDGNLVYKTIYFFFGYLKIVFLTFFNRYNIIHIHLSERGSFFRGYLIFMICKLFHKKVIIHEHGSDFEDFYNNVNSFIKKLIRKLLRRSDIVLVLGEKWKKIILEIENDTNIQVLKNAIPIPSIDTPNRVTKDFNVLFLAVLEKRKGVMDILQAINEVVKNIDERKNHIRLIVAGSGEEEFNAKEYVKKHNLSSFVEFTGWVNKGQKEMLFKKSQLFVLPSYNEGLPMAILEAISYGLPVISSDVGSVDEAVFDGKNGFLISPGDTVALSKYISKIVLSNDMWESFVKYSRKLAINEFDEKIFLEKLKEIYNTLS